MGDYFFFGKEDANILIWMNVILKPDDKYLKWSRSSLAEEFHESLSFPL